MAGIGFPVAALTGLAAVGTWWATETAALVVAVLVIAILIASWLIPTIARRRYPAAFANSMATVDRRR
jgi:hypothetical protein